MEGLSIEDCTDCLEQNTSQILAVMLDLVLIEIDNANIFSLPSKKISFLSNTRHFLAFRHPLTSIWIQRENFC